MQNSTTSAWLVVNEGTTDEFSFELTKKETTLGRGSDNDIRVDDPLASRHHAVIQIRADGYQIKDQHSSNGTLLNDEGVLSSPIAAGDLIQIGSTTLRFKMHVDPDATIMQKRPGEETVVALRPTIPHEHGAVHCRKCGQPNPKGGKFCSKCGAALPQLPASFQKTLDKFNKLQSSFQAGDLSQGNYQTALKNLLVQDDEGDYWMLGMESGEWYCFDGDEWHLRLPPLKLSIDEQPPQPEMSDPEQPDRSERSLTTRPKAGRWGVIAAWLISAIAVVVFGIYAAAEFNSFSQFQSLGQPDDISPSAAGSSTDSSEPAAGESEIPITAATPTLHAQDTKNEINARPYNPASDASLLNLVAEAEFLPDQSTKEYAKYTNNFPDTNGFLTMAWCAIDQNTMEDNLASMQMTGTFDSITIPPEMWTEDNSQEEGMYCRFYRTVVEDLEPGTHKFFWSTSYDDSIFDGWDTYQPGTYINEFILKIEDQYNYNDNFDNNADHWGETDRDEVRVWIEGGDLHIELYQESMGVYSSFRDRDFDDFTITTLASSLNPYPGYYGIVFREQDVNNYYYFQINDEGSYRLGKIVGGETIDLIPWTASEIISKNGGVNKLYLSMEGIRILGYINDQLVVDTNDGSLKNGDLGLMAFTPEGVDGSHISFQQVSIEAPK